MDSRKKTYSIGQVSSLCSVSIKTLRYYDKMGLLIPAERKDGSNYRYYTHEQILILFIIRRLYHLGLPLKEIKDNIYLKDTKNIESCIRQRFEKINHSIEELNNQYAEGKLLLERLEKGHSLLEFEKSDWETEGMRIETIPCSNVLFTRRKKKNYKNSDVSIERWFELFEMVSRYGLKATGSVILTYHNNPLEQFYQNDCDLEMCIQINESTDVPEAKSFGGFTAVTALHFGRNEDI
ncbi:MAG: MerR family transcriptional regulator, partial [Acetivibrio ethanolgignens]